jgi:hypothetical protein
MNITTPKIVPVLEVFVGEPVTYILGKVVQVPPEHLTHVSPPLQSTETLVLLGEFLLSSDTIVVLDI